MRLLKFYDRKVQVMLVGIGALMLLMLSAPSGLSAAKACITTESEACCADKPSSGDCPNATLVTKNCYPGYYGTCVQDCTWRCIP